MEFQSLARSRRLRWHTSRLRMGGWRRGRGGQGSCRRCGLQHKGPPELVSRHCLGEQSFLAASRPQSDKDGAGHRSRQSHDGNAHPDRECHAVACDRGYPSLDQLLQPILQIGAVSDASSDRRLPRQMGATQVQATSAEVEGCSGLARTGDPNIAGSVCPLAACACRRSDTGSRMSREAYVRVWERVGVKFPRAAR